MIRPRPYLSYSQLKLWESKGGPDKYRDQYLFGKQGFTNRGQALGSQIANSLESGQETGDLQKDLIVAQFPKYDLMDKEIMVDLKDGKEVIPLLLKPDSCKSDHSAFYEYKTGKAGSWSQAKVDKDDQLTFYATGLYIITKKIPQLELIHAETEKDDIGKPVLNGSIKSFPSRRGQGQIASMIKRIKTAWKEIGEMCEREML